MERVSTWYGYGYWCVARLVVKFLGCACSRDDRVVGLVATVCVSYDRNALLFHFLKEDFTFDVA